MSDNPFDSSADAPKPSPEIGRLAQVSEQLGLESAGLGRETLDWAKELDTLRFDTARPVIEQQMGLATENAARGRESAERYRTQYQPLENLQLYDSLGAGWTSVEAQDRLVDQTADRQLQSLDRDFKTGVLSRRDYNQQRAEINQRRNAEKQMLRVSKAAEDSASSRAMADAAAGEGRFITGLDDEASRMGVDPSRIMAGAGAAAPSSAAAAVHGGNQARFGFRDAQSKNLATGVNTGRAIESNADQSYGLALNAGNAAVGNVNATTNASVASRTAPGAYFGQAMSGLGQAIGGHNTAFNQENAAFQSEAERDAGMLQTIGTLGGMALYKSSRDVKTDNEPLPDDILESIDGLDVESWRYKPGHEDGGAQRHVGPYADQMAELGLSDGETLNSMDTAGLALAGVKALKRKVDQIGLSDAEPRAPKARPAEGITPGLADVYENDDWLVDSEAARRGITDNIRPGLSRSVAV